MHTRHLRRRVSKPAGAAANAVLATLLGSGLACALVFAAAIPARAVPPGPVQAEEPPSAERQRELVRFVRQECGFCHGLRLTGGIGSSLTAEALAGKPAESLGATIRYGRAGTAMPGWAPFLSEADVDWVVENLLQGFPDEPPR